MKIFICTFILAFSLFLGCQRSHRDAELIGVWQIVTNGIIQTYTFSSDHTFTSTFASAKDLRHFGDWTLNGKQLAIVVRSNSFSPTVVSNRESAHVIKLSDSVLVLKDRDKNEEPRERMFRKIK